MMSTKTGGKSDGDFVDINTDEENPDVNNHDQLPSPEEYKAKMDDDAGIDSSRDVNNPQDGDEGHDLPTVDEYKNSMSFREQEEEPPKSRAGLYTFLCLVLLLIIVTAIAVPLALRNKGKGNSPDEANIGGGGSIGSSPDTSMTSTPIGLPTKAPSSSNLPRVERAVNYLAENGLALRENLYDPTTPQARATNWIVNDDAFQIEIPDNSKGNGGLRYSDTRFTERWSLAVLYYALGGEKWTYKLKFLQPIDHCEWYDRFLDPTGSIIKQGVTECQKFAPNFDANKVSRLEISNNNLDGNVPEEIQFFPYLQTWITPFNRNMTTTSSLDPFLKLGDSLSHLELQYCGIKGKIPEKISNLNLLSFLGLGNNFMTGSIPQSFYQLTNLLVLGLDDNMFEGSINDFAKLNKMQKLYLEDNLINGQITEGLVSSGWKNMIDLDLSVNRIDGTLPPNIWSMTSLEVIDLHGNDLVGLIPEIQSVLSKLFFLAVYDNDLNGQIPESIKNLVNLKHFDIAATKISMPFPSAMEEMSNLMALYTGINGFGRHPVPSFLAKMTNLKELSMKQNQLTGEIPAFLGDLTNLRVLDLDFNQLTGTIPEELGELTNLDTLMLNRNFLNGTIPESFSELLEMDVLLLDGNEITGDASAICGNANMTSDINTTAFTADCGSFNPEIECTCCSVCCDDSDISCNNLDWRINLDGIWEYDFQRVVYAFSQEILPAGTKMDYGNG